MLGRIPQEALAEFARDESFVASVERTYEQFPPALERPGWVRPRSPPERKGDTIRTSPPNSALDVALPIYSGGLGVLSGDHLKTAATWPAARGVGLLYSRVTAANT